MHNHLRAIRFWLIFFMAGLFLSGVTAFPLQTELRWLLSPVVSPKRAKGTVLLAVRGGI